MKVGSTIRGGRPGSYRSTHTRTPSPGADEGDLTMLRHPAFSGCASGLSAPLDERERLAHRNHRHRRLSRGAPGRYLMFRKTTAVLACAALGLLLASAVQAKEVRQNQPCSGAGVLLDEFHANVILTCKGRPSSAITHVFVEMGDLGPPSEKCQGFNFEAPVVDGSVVVVFKDLSKVIGLITSGQICVSLDGDLAIDCAGAYVGGVGRFGAAGGTFSTDFAGVVLRKGFDPPTGVSVSGPLDGTIVPGR
jgi:hypothetical protein